MVKVIFIMEGNLMKKLILFIHILTLIAIFAMTPAYAAEEWEKAEKDLKEFAEEFSSNYTCFLVDLDGDKIPELATVDTEDSREHCLNIYTYEKYKNYGINGEPEDFISHGWGTHYQGSYRLFLDDYGRVKIHEKNETYYLDWSAEDSEIKLSEVEQTLSSWSTKGMSKEAYLYVSYLDNKVSTTSSKEKKVTSKDEFDRAIATFNNKLSNNLIFYAESYSEIIKNAPYGNNWNVSSVWERQKILYGLKSDSENSYITLQIGNPKMNVNGGIKPIDTVSSTSPIIQNGNTLVPIRAIIESFGGQVDWDNSTRTAIVKFNDKDVRLTIGSKVAKVNGNSKTMNIAPVIHNGRTMLPIRFVSENLGISVDWNQNFKFVTLHSGAAKQEQVSSGVSFNGFMDLVVTADYNKLASLFGGISGKCGYAGDGAVHVTYEERSTYQVQGYGIFMLDRRKSYNSDVVKDMNLDVSPYIYNCYELHFSPKKVFNKDGVTQEDLEGFFSRKLNPVKKQVLICNAGGREMEFIDAVPEEYKDIADVMEIKYVTRDDFTFTYKNNTYKATIVFTESGTCEYITLTNEKAWNDALSLLQ